VDPRAGLDYIEKRKFLTLPGLELLPLSRPARSQCLYRLRYPGSDTQRRGDLNTLEVKDSIGLGRTIYIGKELVVVLFVF
jgi:hypothetical protein